ncbi:g866 [Coccomyxa elongata]
MHVNIARSWLTRVCTAALLLGAHALRWVMQDPYGIQLYHDRFDPTDALLARAIDEPVDLLPLAEDSVIVSMIANGSADLLYMGTTLFTCMQAEHGAMPLAMIVEDAYDRNISSLAGAVFTLANSTQIQVATDLRNRVIGTGPLNYLSSFQLPWAYVQDHGLDLFADAAGVFLTDNSLAVVLGVADGTLDVGFTRAGYIEHLQSEGQVQSGIFSYLDPRTWEGYPFATTTPLYPELVVAVMPHVAMITRNRIAAALLSIDPQKPEAVVGQYTYWTTPPVLIPTINLQQRLGIAQFPFSACTTLFDIYSAIVCALTLAQLVATVFVIFAVACVITATALGRWRKRHIERGVIGKNRHGCVHAASLNGEAVLAERALPRIAGAHADGSLAAGPLPWTPRLLLERALRELALPSHTYSRARSVCAVAALQHELLLPCLGVLALSRDSDVALLHPRSPRRTLHDLLVNKTVTMTLSLVTSALHDIACVLTYLHSKGVVGMAMDTTYVEIDSSNRFCLRRSLPSGPTLTAAPELLRGGRHTMASDTFAFAMLMARDPARAETVVGSSSSSYDIGMGIDGLVMQDDVLRDVSEGWFFGIGNMTNNDATHVQRAMKLALGIVSVPALAGVHCSAHVGTVCGRVMGCVRHLSSHGTPRNGLDT